VDPGSLWDEDEGEAEKNIRKKGRKKEGRNKEDRIVSGGATTLRTLLYGVAGGQSEGGRVLCGLLPWLSR
jgi:hypothetical protein